MTQVLSLLESLSHSVLALILGLLELIPFSPLLVQILSVLVPASFNFFGSGFDHVRTSLCTSEVQFLSMSEPLFLFLLKHFSFFLKIKHSDGIYNGNENWKLEINRSSV